MMTAATRDGMKTMSSAIETPPRALRCILKYVMGAIFWWKEAGYKADQRVRPKGLYTIEQYLELL